MVMRVFWSAVRSHVGKCLCMFMYVPFMGPLVQLKLGIHVPSFGARLTCKRTTSARWRPRRPRGAHWHARERAHPSSTLKVHLRRSVSPRRAAHRSQASLRALWWRSQTRATVCCALQLSVFSSFSSYDSRYDRCATASCVPAAVHEPRARVNRVRGACFRCSW